MKWSVSFKDCLACVVLVVVYGLKNVAFAQNALSNCKFGKQQQLQQMFQRLDVLFLLILYFIPKSKHTFIHISPHSDSTRTSSRDRSTDAITEVLIDHAGPGRERAAPSCSTAADIYSHLQRCCDLHKVPAKQLLIVVCLPGISLAERLYDKNSTDKSFILK